MPKRKYSSWFIFLHSMYTVHCTVCNFLQGVKIYIYSAVMSNFRHVLHKVCNFTHTVYCLRLFCKFLALSCLTPKKNDQGVEKTPFCENPKVFRKHQSQLVRNTVLFVTHDQCSRNCNFYCFARRKLQLLWVRRN